jgi:AcrR family transcriptional regulator
MKEDARIIQSKALLQQAFLMLLKDKTFDQISIAELCRKAGVSRQTFYSNYKYKEDVLLEHLDDILNEFYSYNLPQLEFDEVFQILSKIFIKYHEFLQNLFRANLDFQIMFRFEKLLKRMNSDLVNHSLIEYINCFFAGGMYLVLRKWLLMGTPITALELTSVFKQISTPVIQPLRQKNTN